MSMSISMEASIVFVIAPLAASSCRVGCCRLATSIKEELVEEVKRNFTVGIDVNLAGDHSMKAGRSKPKKTRGGKVAEMIAK